MTITNAAPPIDEARIEDFANRAWRPSGRSACAAWSASAATRRTARWPGRPGLLTSWLTVDAVG
jgi:hypothetical protein